MTLLRCHLAAAALLQPFALHAQIVHGVAVDQAGHPIAGVVVQLLDSNAVAISRSLSSERGEFRLAGTHAGRYTIKTLRIGYRPESVGPITLRIGEEVSRQLVLAGIPISLEAVQIVDRNACQSARDSAAATFAVWEQARIALTATQLTGAGRSVAATTMMYERAMDPGSRRVKTQSANLSADFVTQPWRSAPADSLHRAGYVVTEYDGSTVYFAPGLDVLLSDAFVEDHCLRLVTDRDQSRIGVGFEPTSGRQDVPEIRGTLWLDRASSELRRLEFGYVHLPPEQEGVAAGEMEFVRMKNSMWAVTRWSIRMPVLERVARARQFGGDQTRLAEVRVAGGELALVRRGADTLWTHSALVLAGTVHDSVSGFAVAAARVDLAGTTLHGATDARGQFTIPGVLPGEYMLEVHTPLLDSVSAVYHSAVMITDAAPIEVRVPNSIASYTAVFTGLVVDTISQPIAAAEVSLPELSKTVLTNEHGAFRLAGIPAGKHRVRVRHVGHGSVDRSVNFVAGQTLDWRFVLTRTTTLDSVVITAEHRNALLEEFEEHRKLGLGHFLTRADIVQHEGLQLSSMLEQVPGLKLVHGRGGSNSWILSPVSFSNSPYYPEKFERTRGMSIACYAQVYVDGMLMNPAVSMDPQVNVGAPPGGVRATPPFDVNSIPPSKIEAVEYYASPAQTPARYAGLGSGCGVLLIHTLRVK